MFRKFALLLGLILLFCSTKLFAQDDVTKLQSQIEALQVKMEKASLAGDYDELVSIYAEDLISLPNFGEMTRGKQKVLQQIKRSKKLGVQIISVSSTIIEIWSDKENVYVVGKFGMSFRVPEKSHPVSDQGKYFNVWQKQPDGSLKLKIDIWNTDLELKDWVEQLR